MAQAFNFGNTTDDQGFSDQETQAMMTPRPDAASASFELGFQDTPMGALGRYLADKEAEDAGGSKQLPHDLNEQFPGMNFQEPMTARMAQMLYNRQQDRQKLQQAVDMGTNTWTDKVANFATGTVLPQMLDPINFAGMAVTGGVANALGAGALTGKAAFGAAMAEGVVGNSFGVPLVAMANHAEGRDYTAADYLQEAVLPGMIMGGTMHFAGNLLRKMGILDPKAAEATSKAAEGMDAQGKDPRIGFEALRQEKAMETRGTAMPYENQPMSLERPFYAASTTVDRPLETADLAHIGEDVGGGMKTFTDDPNVANGSAARSGYSKPGTMHSVDLSEANIKHLTPEEAAPLFNDPEAMDAFKNDLKSQGFDGFSYSADHDLGIPRDQAHNVVAMFDDAKVSEMSRMAADPDAVPKMSRQQMSDIQQKIYGHGNEIDSSGVIDDKEAYRQAEQQIKETPDGFRETGDDLHKSAQEALDNLKPAGETEGNTGLSPAESRQINDAQAQLDRFENFKKMARDAVNC